MHVFAFIVFAFAASDSASVMTLYNNWDTLKVRWSINPNNRFLDMPATTQKATEMGFFQVSNCSTAENATFRGARYVKDDDESIVLLFDKNGFIAGIQSVISSCLLDDYPDKGGLTSFVRVGDKYYVTAYFVHPSTICSIGCTDQKFESKDGVLLIQDGQRPDEDYMEIPTQEKDLADTSWVKGKCLYTMGQHYWYNITRDMSCDTFFPAFLLYNGGKLNAFGWGFGAKLSLKHFENPSHKELPLFFNDVPKCLYKLEGVTTLHIFLTSTPAKNFC